MRRQSKPAITASLRATRTAAEALGLAPPRRFSRYVNLGTVAVAAAPQPLTSRQRDVFKDAPGRIVLAGSQETVRGKGSDRFLAHVPDAPGESTENRRTLTAERAGEAVQGYLGTRLADASVPLVFSGSEHKEQGRAYAVAGTIGELVTLEVGRIIGAPAPPVDPAQTA